MVMEEKNLKTILEVSDLMRRYDQVYSRWAESRGFSTNAMSLMEELHLRPEGMEPAVIADYLGVPRQTMTSTLDSLERRGIIERRAHATDRRRKVIRFTAAGREIADSLINELHRWMMAALVPVEPRELERTLSEVRAFCLRLESAVSSNTEEKRSPCN